MSPPEATSPRRLLTAGVLLGIGMSALLDRVVVREVLHASEVLSAPQPTVADLQGHILDQGVFDAAVWALVLTGVVVLFAAGRGARRFWSGRALAGAMLLGSAGFTLAAGVVGHRMLGLDGFGPRHGPWVDWSLLASGATLAAAGGWLVSVAMPPPRPRTDTREVAAACAIMAG